MEAFTKQQLVRTELYKRLRAWGQQNNVFRLYEDIGDTGLSAFFSGTNLHESIHKGNGFQYMPVILFNINDIIQKSTKIEEHLDNKNDKNVLKIHELLSFLGVDEGIIVIKTTIKELKGLRNNDPHVIYTLSSYEVIKERMIYPPQTNDDNHSLEAGNHPSTHNLIDILRNVKEKSVKKYIPLELINDQEK